MSMMTHIPMLLHHDPTRVLVICFGTGRTAGTGLLYPGAQIDVVDINRAVFGFASSFRQANRAVAESPRARLIVDDGRNFLLTTPRRYDVITAEPMPPRFAGVVNFYTREYYALARERLLPDGIVVQWLPMHLLTLSESLRVVRTMLDVFPQTSLWLHASTGIVVSRNGGPLSLDLNALQGRLVRPALAADLAGVGVTGLPGFANLYALGPDALERLTRSVRPITDDIPSLEFHVPRHRWFQTDLWLCLELLFRLRRDAALPLAGGTPEQVADLQESHVASSYALLGDLYLSLEMIDKARAEYEAGMARSRRPQDRALFLFARAQLAQADGDEEAARRLLDLGLALDPTNLPARALKRRFEGG
jgi:hypothetical protein